MAKMKQKDYELIAYVITDIRVRKAKDHRIAEIFADYLQMENPRFDRDKFLKKCGWIKPE